jgi:ferredoxin-NADP reductase
MNTATPLPAGVAIGSSPDLIEVRLTAVTYAARDTNLYEFRRPDGAPLPAAEPGAHIDLHLPNGMLRQYSLTVSEPDPTRYVVGIKRDPESRGGSRYIFEELHVGRLIKISAPRNNFPLVEAPHVVLIAGGIGITPIWCMVQRLRAQGRPFTLHYACRSRTDTACLAPLSEMNEVRFHFDDEAAGKFLDVGAAVTAAPANAHFYCCGPIPMLRAFEEATKPRPPEHVHVEYFTAKEEANLEGGFVVQLSRTGKEFVIPPGKSILEVLQDAGLNVPYSCQEGICGACETTVISGLPDHRDSVLTDAERAANKTMMICCGGCKGDKLVLDI